jgi:hypothetical protein
MCLKRSMARCSDTACKGSTVRNYCCRRGTRSNGNVGSWKSGTRPFSERRKSAKVDQ